MYYYLQPEPDCEECTGNLRSSDAQASEGSCNLKTNPNRIRTGLHLRWSSGLV